MELLKHLAELVESTQDQGALTLEFLVAGEDGLPEDPGVLTLRLEAPVGEAIDVESWQKDTVWSIVLEEAGDASQVRIEGEEHSLTLQCREVQHSWSPLARRHYARIIEGLASSADSAWKDLQQAHRRLERAATFVREQIRRAEIILAEAAASRADARLRAEARLRALREVDSMLKEDSRDSRD